MTSNVPIIRFIAWFSFIPQLCIMALLVYILHLFNVKEPFMWGALLYLALFYSLRNLVAKDHRAGIKLVREQHFADAIPLFEKSVSYFSKNKWVDTYRFITVLSSSKYTYKEMGMCNVAFYHAQIGNGQKATEYYQAVLKEFPKNGIAIAALNMMNAGNQNKNS